MAMTDAINNPSAHNPGAHNPTAVPQREAQIGRPGRNWLAALKAVSRLLSNKEDTGQVFEIMRALNGNATVKNYAQLLRMPGGGRLAYEHVELAPLLMDDAWLDSFAPGTVGAAYRDFIRSEQISAEGLAEVSRQGATQIDVKHPYAWFGRRMRDSHDLWHILSGYHRDGLGEACLVAFSYAQTRGLGWAFIATAAALRGARGPQPTVQAIWQGYQRGKAAKWLPGEDYVALMAEPLEAARRRLGITPATTYDAIPGEYRNPEPTMA
jgi:ubiquinone biosynthesis protein COQ4